MPLPLGKLPATLLADLLASIPAGDASVVVGPAAGVDAAVVVTGGGRLVVSADPITLAGGRAGWYAVHVNANDIAVMGGTPRWFVATVLLPPATDEAAVRALFAEIAATCAGLGVALIGGHTEVTARVDRPVIAGTMLGELAPGRLVTSAGARPGDRLIVTGGVGIEGTAALATDAAGALRARGVGERLLERAAAFLDEPGISVVRAARLLLDAGPVRAMHDATEGGVATALAELAAASGTGLAVEAAALPVREETATICRALALDPLGLLASGCLIAAVPPEAAGGALTALRAAAIEASHAGEVTTAADGRRLRRAGRDEPLPEFARDELARWFEAGEARS